MSSIADNEEDEFYVSFSSQACPDIHPQNKANNFQVSWQTAKELTGRWKVALTEVRYNNIHSIANSRFGVSCEKLSQVTSTFMAKLTVTNNTLDILVKQPPPAVVSLPVVRKTSDDHVMINSEICKQFTISFDSLSEAQRCGFTTQIVRTENGMLVAENRIKTSYASANDGGMTDMTPPPPPENEEGMTDITPPSSSPPPPLPFNIKFVYEFEPTADVFEQYFDDENLIIPTHPSDFCNAMTTLFGLIFTKAEYDDVNHLFTLTVAPDVLSINFENGFNLALGFKNQSYVCTDLVKRTLTADYMPILDNGIPSLKFFMNIIEPSLVDGNEMQLLKSVDIRPSEHQLGENVTRSFQLPMYMNVAVTSINTIAITVKSDSYELAPFIDGSTTVVTLHFKRVQ